jgi:RNA 2',3'-cyclic 3'-phosphodiesterase
MRLFIGVELDAQCRDAAIATANELRSQLGGGASWKWVSSENMHVTVRFIGHVPNERVAEVLAAIAPPLLVEPFDLLLGGLGVFPPAGPPRVLWIGLDHGLESLRAMHAEFNRRLADLGFEPESRAFSAHVTLARARDARSRGGGDVRKVVSQITCVPARCRVSHATTFESRPSTRGPQYVSLAQTQLQP